MNRLKNRSKKILALLSALFIVYSLAGFLLVPYLIKTMATDRLTEFLRRETVIENVRFNPYSFNLRVTGFRVMEGQEVFASFEELRVNLQGRSLIKGGLTVKALTAEKPYLRIVHKKDLSYNFSDIIPKGSAAKEEPQKKSSIKFSFNNIRVTGGSVDFIDEPKGKAHEVRDVLVEIPFVSSIPSEVEIFVKPSFSARVNGTPFELRGESKPFADSSETSLAINFNGLSIPEYLAYSPVPLKFRMPSGLLFADLDLTYIQYRDRAPELTLKGGLSLKDVELQDEEGQRITRLPSLDIGITSIDVFGRKARLSSVVLDRPDVALVRKADGSMNIMSLVPGERGEEPEAEKEGAFTLDIERAGAAKARLSFSDLTKETPFRRSLEPVDLSLTGFSTAAGKSAAARISYSHSSGEAILAEGSISVNPIAAEMELKADALDLKPLQPYLDDVVNLIITKGRASARGTVSAGLGDEGTRLSYRGSAAVSGLSAVARPHGGELIRWGSLSLDGIEFDLSPRRIVARSVVLSDFSSNIVVGSDGSLNAANIIASRPEQKAQVQAATGDAGKSEPAYMRIDSVALRNGRVDFRDLHIEPIFIASIDEVNGRVKGLYLDGSSLADISLSGIIDKYAPFEAAGKINPKKDALFIDMKVKLNGLELSSLTPYSGKYIGYGIEKGKLFLDLGYFIEKRALKADNNVLIDQITLGGKVESPQATSLPVGFAISLLKDRSGQIRLDVPLSGSLDDPEFSVGALILQVILNLIEKAVTSPFAVMGGLFGGGEDLGFVEFEAGSDALTEASVKKLDALVAALYERPGLKLDIEGFVSEDDDAKGLSERKFMRALKEEKMRETDGAGRPAAEVDAVEMGKDEYERYLFLAYKRADFKKETNFIGMVKRLPEPELERLLREHLKATDDDLRALAASRSNAVRDHILGTGKVEPSRVFIRWPKELKPEKKEGQKESRVEFKLE